MIGTYLLAIAHHLTVFSLVATLAMETALLRADLSRDDVRRLGRCDLVYGGLAVLVLLIGFTRAALGPKGWAYYQDNPLFWAKIAAFALVGLCSLPPTLRILAWRRSGDLPQKGEIAALRRWMVAEWAILATIPLLAAGLGLGL